jgi:phosphoribosylaminoimidazolecarboxamide formyltransferase/IMP cyclohydrolase
VRGSDVIENPSKFAPKIRRALLSVFDKTGLPELGRALAERGVELVSTGGTAKALRDAGLRVVDVAEVTGFPEMLGGRVKTLHPRLHGGLLAKRGDDEHEAALQQHAIPPIELLVVNLYPFAETLASGATPAQILEMIDVGGPAMIRGAAKNHASVTVVVDPADYAPLLAELSAENGGTSPQFREKLAAKAFARTAAYDSAIADWLGAPDETPESFTLSGSLVQALRYGENPHQRAAFYRTGEARPGVATARQLQGKELSFNNIADTDAAFELVAEFHPGTAAACAIIKHANPCGVAIAASLEEAYQKALAADPVAAFGGVVAFNRPLDAATARRVAEIFTEVIIAPAAHDDAQKILAAKKNLRLLAAGGLPDPAAAGRFVRSVAGGFLVQDRDSATADVPFRTVTRREPTEQELADLRFALRVCKHVKSNAIVFARDGATAGIGAGQMSRVDSVKVAAAKAAEVAAAAGLSEPLTRGSVVASDAFFPFPDGLLAAADAGATACVQPGGSMRDQEVIAAADARGLAMVFSGIRHFRH